MYEIPYRIFCKLEIVLVLRSIVEMKRSMPSTALSSKTNENLPVFARNCFKTIIFNLILRVFSSPELWILVQKYYLYGNLNDLKDQLCLLYMFRMERCHILSSFSSGSSRRTPKATFARSLLVWMLQLLISFILIFFLKHSCLRFQV